MALQTWIENGPGWWGAGMWDQVKGVPESKIRSAVWQLRWRVLQRPEIYCKGKLHYLCNDRGVQWRLMNAWAPPTWMLQPRLQTGAACLIGELVPLVPPPSWLESLRWHFQPQHCSWSVSSCAVERHEKRQFIMKDQIHVLMPTGPCRRDRDDRGIIRHLHTMLVDRKSRGQLPVMLLWTFSEKLAFLRRMMLYHSFCMTADIEIWNTDNQHQIWFGDEIRCWKRSNFKTRAKNV